MHVRLNGGSVEKWVVLSTLGSKWQRMEVVKWLWYTE